VPRRNRRAEIRARVKEALALNARVTKGLDRVVREEPAGEIAWRPGDHARDGADSFYAFRTLAPALAKDVEILLAAVDVLRDVRPYVAMCQSATSGREFQENAKRNLRRIDVVLRAVDGGSKHPDRCRLCGRSEFVVAVDNHGSPYMGCKHCVVMPLPPEGEG